MKKLFTILCVVVAFSVNAHTTVKWPKGNATALTISTTSTLTSLTLVNDMSYVASIPTLTAACTISVTAGSQLKPGAMAIFTIKTNGSELTTFAGAITSVTVAGSAGKTWSQGFIYNGTKFYPMGVKQQVD